MCGILGVVQMGQQVDQRSVIGARDLLAYRGPDGAGLWETRLGDLGVTLGHRRLSIIDLSCAGSQPMLLTADGTARPATQPDDPGVLALTYNGEIYNYVELRDELRSLGRRFTSGSDTEVLVHAYAQWGADCLQRLNGMFALALWDSNRRVLFCARDRFGEKPFHFVVDHKRGVFGFASEMKTLMALGLATPTFDDRALFRYFAFGEQAGVSQTIWAGIHRLLAGHALEVRADRQGVRMRTYRYWDVHPDDEYVPGERRAQQEFRELFQSSVALRLRSDVPVGTSLSGGLDSTSVLCQIKELGTLHGQKAFTARMDDPAMDESGIVQSLLSDVGIPGYVVTPTGSAFLEQSDRLFFHQEEPYPSTSMFASYLVHGLAKANAVTVLLDGQGADEYLAGYAHYPALVLASLARRGHFHRWWTERRALRERVGSDPVPLRAAVLLWMQSMSNGAGTLPIDQHREIGHLAMEFRGAHADELPRSIPLGRSALKTRMYADLMLGHLQELLRYTDRNSMAHSREVRLPFLDHRLVDFCLRLPESYLYRDGQSKWILRESLRGIVPSTILDRRDKVGFATPWARWWSEPGVGDVLRERLADARRALEPWVGKGPIPEGSPAALDVLALASIRTAFEEYRPKARSPMAGATR